MSKDMSYEAVLSRKGEIIKASAGIDFSKFESGGLAFDYEGMLKSTGYDIDAVRSIQKEVAVGDTPIIELRNMTALARAFAPSGKGARIFIKDEAANPSGSFKDRRAAIAAFHAKKAGYKGLIADKRKFRGCRCKPSRNARLEVHNCSGMLRFAHGGSA